MIERLNEEIKRRTHIVRIFPDEESCHRLILALAVEQHEEWQEGSVYLNMQPLTEQRRKLLLQEVA
jgi:putative transposase